MHVSFCSFASFVTSSFAFFLLNHRQAYFLRSLTGSSVKKSLDSPRATCTLLFIVFNSQTNVKHELKAIQLIQVGD